MNLLRKLRHDRAHDFHHRVEDLRTSYRSAHHTESRYTSTDILHGRDNGSSLEAQGRSSIQPVLCDVEIERRERDVGEV